MEYQNKFTGFIVEAIQFPKSNPSDDIQFRKWLNSNGYKKFDFKKHSPFVLKRQYEMNQPVNAGDFIIKIPKGTHFVMQESQFNLFYNKV